MAGISDLFSAIPVIGPIASLGSTIASGVTQAVAADKQAKQAEKVRQDAMHTQMLPMSPEFMGALHAKQLQSMSDMPGFQANKDLLAQQVADTMKHIRLMSPNGNASLEAMSNALGQQNKSLLSLGAENSAYRANQMNDANKLLWGVGQERNRLQDIQQQQKAEGLKAASALENAATYNKQNAINTITGGIGSTASSIANNAQMAQAENNNASFNNAYLNWLMGNPGTKYSSPNVGIGNTSNSIIANPTTTEKTYNPYMPPELYGATGNLTPFVH